MWHSCQIIIMIIIALLLPLEYHKVLTHCSFINYHLRVYLQINHEKNLLCCIFSTLISCHTVGNDYSVGHRLGGICRSRCFTKSVTNNTKDIIRTLFMKLCGRFIYFTLTYLFSPMIIMLMSFSLLFCSASSCYLLYFHVKAIALYYRPFADSTNIDCKYKMVNIILVNMIADN